MVTSAYKEDGSLAWFRSPTVEIPPVKGLDYKIAHASGTMINQVIEEAKVEGKFRSAIFNGLLYGCGWVRFGYHTQFPTEDQIEKLNTDPFAENDALALEGQIREPQEGEDHARHITVHQALLENPEIIKAIISKWGLAAPIKLAAHIEKHRQLKEKEERRGRADSPPRNPLPGPHPSMLRRRRRSRRRIRSSTI